MRDHDHEGKLGDLRNRAKREQEEAYIRRRKAEIFHTLGQRPDFRLFLGWLAQRGGLTDVLYDADTEHLFFREGRRSVALETLKEIEEHLPGFSEAISAERRKWESEIRNIHKEKDDGSDQG